MLKYIDEGDVIYTDVKVRILHAIFILKLCYHYIRLFPSSPYPFVSVTINKNELVSNIYHDLFSPWPHLHDEQEALDNDNTQ